MLHNTKEKSRKIIDALMKKQKSKSNKLGNITLINSWRFSGKRGTIKFFKPIIRRKSDFIPLVQKVL